MNSEAEIFFIHCQVFEWQKKTIYNFYVIYSDEMQHLALSKILIFT